MKSKFWCKKKIRDLVIIRASFTFLLTMFRGFFKFIFKLLLQIQQENGFYLPVNTDKPIFLAFLYLLVHVHSVSFVDYGICLFLKLLRNGTSKR